MDMFRIHADDMGEDACPSFVHRISQCYRAVVAELKRVALFEEKECITLFPMVWSVTCHPHDDEQLMDALLHILGKVSQDFIADTIRAWCFAQFGTPQTPLKEHRVFDVVIQIHESKAFLSHMGLDLEMIKCCWLIPRIIAACVGAIRKCMLARCAV